MEKTLDGGGEGGEGGRVCELPNVLRPRQTLSQMKEVEVIFFLFFSSFLFLFTPFGEVGKEEGGRVYLAKQLRRFSFLEADIRNDSITRAVKRFSNNKKNDSPLRSKI